MGEWALRQVNFADNIEQNLQKIYMIDFHSHILPKIDDGSQSAEESILILEELSRQGVKTVVATPHFLANRNSVDEFIEKRIKSLESIKGALTKEVPQVLCGAEVRYYLGISRMNGLEKLCIEGTNILLIEMFPAKWSQFNIKELEDIARDFIVVIAHVERYIGYQSKKTIDRLIGSGILMQCNARYFLRPLTRRKAINRIKNGEIHLIGSDCHNLTSRPPNMKKAIDYIEKKLGSGFLEKHNEFVSSVLKISKV